MSTALRTYSRGHNLVTVDDEVTNESRVYHFDHQGTTQCLTDGLGAVTDRFASDACGVVVKREGTNSNPAWFMAAAGFYQSRQSDTTYTLPLRSVYSARVALTLGLTAPGTRDLLLALARFALDEPQPPVPGEQRQPIELGKIKCPPVKSCDDAKPDCVEVGTLWLHYFLPRPRNSQTGENAPDDSERGATLALGYKNLPGADIRTACGCARVSWVQFITSNQPNDPTCRKNPGGWCFDDSGASKRGQCRFLANSDANPGKQAWLPKAMKDYVYWLHDSPSQLLDAGVFHAKEASFVSCLVCEGRPVGANWVIEESCVSWGYRARSLGVSRLESAQVGFTNPNVKSTVASLLNAANCPNNEFKDKGWVISPCPP